MYHYTMPGVTDMSHCSSARVTDMSHHTSARVTDMIYYISVRVTDMSRYSSARVTDCAITAVLEWQTCAITPSFAWMMGSELRFSSFFETFPPFECQEWIPATKANMLAFFFFFLLVFNVLLILCEFHIMHPNPASLSLCFCPLALQCPPKKIQNISCMSHWSGSRPLASAMETLQLWICRTGPFTPGW